MSIRILFILLCTYAANTYAGASENAFAGSSDFDAVCQHFSTLDKKLKSDKLSNKQRREFINGLVAKTLADDSPARQALDVVVYAVPAERYEMFQFTAQEVTGKNWSCESMNKLMDSVGD